MFLLAVTREQMQHFTISVTMHLENLALSGIFLALFLSVWCQFAHRLLFFYA